MRSKEELEQIFERVSRRFSFEGAHLELASEQRIDELISFIAKHFIPDLPMLTTVGLKYDEAMKELLCELLQKRFSVFLISNETNEIVGFVTSYYVHKKDNASSPLNKARSIMHAFFAQKDDEMTVFDKYHVDKAIRIDDLCIDRRLRSRGFGLKLVQAAVAYFRERETGPIALKVECLHVMSDAIFVKLGFELLHDLPYADFEVDGNFIFKHISGGVTIRVKLI